MDISGLSKATINGFSYEFNHAGSRAWLVLADGRRHELGKVEATMVVRRAAQDRVRAARQDRLRGEQDFGGVLGADGQVYSDADPGL